MKSARLRSLGEAPLERNFSSIGHGLLGVAGEQRVERHQLQVLVGLASRGRAAGRRPGGSPARGCPPPSGICSAAPSCGAGPGWPARPPAAPPCAARRPSSRGRRPRGVRRPGPTRSKACEGSVPALLVEGFRPAVVELLFAVEPLLRPRRARAPAARAGAPALALPARAGAPAAGACACACASCALAGGAAAAASTSSAAITIRRSHPFTSGNDLGPPPPASSCSPSPSRAPATRCTRTRKRRPRDSMRPRISPSSAGLSDEGRCATSTSSRSSSSSRLATPGSPERTTVCRYRRFSPTSSSRPLLLGGDVHRLAVRAGVGQLDQEHRRPLEVVADGDEEDPLARGRRRPRPAARSAAQWRPRRNATHQRGGQRDGRADAPPADAASVRARPGHARRSARRGWIRAHTSAP